MNMPSECSQRCVQNGVNTCGRHRVLLKNSWRIKIALESYFEERAQETWERNLRKTTLLNTCNPILMETILKVLREQFKNDDQSETAGEIAGFVPETSLDLETILKERGGFWGGELGIFVRRSDVDCEPGLVQGLAWHKPVHMLRSSQRRSMKQE